MDRYVDGFVLPVPNDSLDEYREMAAEAGKLWMEHGALEYFEGVGDDMEPDMDGMSLRAFPQFADAGDDESVVFAFVVFESREHRDEVNARVESEMEEEYPVEGSGTDSERQAEEMPFDMERMAYGGFKSLVSYED